MIIDFVSITAFLHSFGSNNKSGINFSYCFMVGLLRFTGAAREEAKGAMPPKF